MTVKAVDLKGWPVTLRLDKFPSRIFQHEFDHLQVSLRHPSSPVLGVDTCPVTPCC